MTSYRLQVAESVVHLTSSYVKMCCASVQLTVAHERFQRSIAYANIADEFSGGQMERLTIRKPFCGWNSDGCFFMNSLPLSCRKK